MVEPRVLAAWALLAAAGWRAPPAPLPAPPEEGPRAPRCHPDCTKWGNCGEDGFCRCPFGRLGEACEIDFLAPCRQFPDTHAYCGTSATKSCECMTRCKQFICRPNSEGQELCEGFWAPQPGRGCYIWEGLPPDQQYSRIPEEGDAVKFVAWGDEGRQLSREEALRDPQGGGELESVPLSLCPDECSRRGYCTRHWKNAGEPPFCRCHRGYAAEPLACLVKNWRLQGHNCGIEENRCYLQCNGRGRCQDFFCKCEPPFFSIGCSRSRVYPPHHSAPSPINFKIYMYELQTQQAYENEYFTGWQQHDPIYTAYQRFMAQFLLSPVRTEDPSEANLFYIPSMTYSYSANLMTGQEHLSLLIDHLRAAHPWWNRTGGRDHFVWTPADRGTCYLAGQAQDLIHITHFGMHSTLGHHSPQFGHLGHPEYGCFHPLRDVVAVPHDVPGYTGFLAKTAGMSLEDILGKKDKLFFFAGGVRPDDPTYAGSTRKILAELAKEWNDPDFSFVSGYVGDYEDQLRRHKFCLAPYGHGWGLRLRQSILCACIPVVVQEHVVQAYEDLIPYETFTIRLSNADLPRLRETLRGVSEQQYKEMLAALLRYYKAFSWEAEQGGQAFDYTVASLRRRYWNLKASYF